MTLSMRMTALASEDSNSTYVLGSTETNYAFETEDTNMIMPRYTANVEWKNIPSSHVTKGNNKFHMNGGGKIDVAFQSTGKFSLAAYNHDTENIGKYYCAC